MKRPIDSSIHQSNIKLVQLFNYREEGGGGGEGGHPRPNGQSKRRQTGEKYTYSLYHKVGSKLLHLKKLLYIILIMSIVDIINY